MARQKAVKSKKSVKADIDFEKDLWGAANELRGAVAENQYKDFVLSLIFLKHVSERYEKSRQELIAAMQDKTSPYFTEDPEEINYVLTDPDEFHSRHTIILPEKATWAFLQDHADQPNIKVLVDQAFQTVDELLGNYRQDLKGILPPIFVKSQLSATQTGELIKLFSNPKFSQQENQESDVLGRIYEYYIGRFAMAEGSGAGQFFTPGSIVRLLVEMLEPLQGRIFDPACGSGGMFVQSMKFIEAHNGTVQDISIYGQERYQGTLRLCKMNLFLRNLSFEVKLGDSLLNDQFPELEADYVIANPPFNISKWHAESLSTDDPRLFGPRDTYTTDGNANYMWMQTFWSHLSPRGTAGVVMANGAMTSNTKGEKEVRQHMVDQGMIDCIVRLPDKLFLTTGIPACLFFLSKTREGKNLIHRERREEVLFIDANQLGTMASRKLRVFEDADIERVANTYHQWRKVGGEYADVLGFCKSASIAEIQEQDYKLTPGIYVGVEEEEDDGIPFAEKMAGLKAQLKAQFAEARELQQIIEQNLEEF